MKLKNLNLKKKAETLYFKAGRDLACVLKLFVCSFPFQKLKNEILNLLKLTNCTNSQNSKKFPA